jgi:hypothetical protein
MSQPEKLPYPRLLEIEALVVGDGANGLFMAVELLGPNSLPSSLIPEILTPKERRMGGRKG